MGGDQDYRIYFQCGRPGTYGDEYAAVNNASYDILVPSDYIVAPYQPDPAGNPCSTCDRPGAGDPIEIGTGNMFLRETDFVSADKRLQFSRVYNSNSSYNSLSTVGNGWQGELDARRILRMDALPPSPPAGYFETSSVYGSASDACVTGWTEIVAGGPSGKADPKWDGVTATYDGAGHCNLSNGQSVPVLGTDTSIGVVRSPDIAQRGITIRRGEGMQYFFYCSQGVCRSSNSNVKFTMTLDTSGYTILDDNGNSEHYDYLGFLSTITYKDGYQQSFVYNNDNNGVGYLTPFGTPTSITDNRGRSITFGYDTYGMLSAVSTPDGATISYNHDAQGRLTTVTNPTGTRTYQYGTTPDTYNTNLLTGLIDENNNTLTTWSYDSSGRATNSAQMVGFNPVNAVKIDYNVDGTRKVTDALGMQRTYAFQNPFGFPQVTSISGPFCSDCRAGAFTTYDGNGFLATSKDWNGNTTQYTFDPNSGLPTQSVEGQGTSVQRTTNTQWDAVLRNPLEKTVLNASNALVAKVDWQYNASGEPLARCAEDPSVTGATSYVCTNTGTVPAGVRRWTYAYCTAVDTTQCPLIGLLLTVADPLNNVTTYAYYMSDAGSCASAPTTCPHRKGDLLSVKNALNQVTTVSSYDGAGRPLALIDANNVETDLQYNARGWLTQTAKRATNGTSGSGDQIIGYGYDNTGNLARITRPDGSYFGFTYDAAHRLTDIADNLGDTIHYTLDAAGNRTREDTKDPSGSLKRSVVRQFNALGQLAKTINADGTTVNGYYNYDANGNPNVLTDGRGTVTNNAFDALNRLSHIEQDPGSAPHVEANTALTYDALDRTTQVQDPQGLPTTYLYDGLNDLTQLSSPDSGTTTATFDAAGNVLTRTDARGIKATYAYDALNRVTSIRYPTTALNVFLTYDTTESNCNLTTEAFGAGRLTRVRDGSGIVKFCYDRFGRMTRKGQTIGTSSFQTMYAYDLANHVTQITTPTLTKIKYTRDGVGRVTQVTYRLSGQTTDTPVVNAVTYYPFGPVASITYNDGRVLNRTYDQDYVISGVTDTSTDGLNLAFGRDVLGNITQVTSGTIGNKFGYDGLNRLTNVNHLSNVPFRTYTYDATGNRLSKQAGTNTPVPYTYTTTSHQLYAVGTTLRGYDAMGDTTTIGTTQGFGYDDTGRMNQVNNGAGTTLMQYATNGLGQRVEKYLTGNTAATQYSVDDESGHALGDYDSTSTRIRETIWMDGMPVGVLSGTAGTLSYIEPDQLGTPRVAIDGTSNAAVWNWSPINDPFGETQPTGSLSLNLRMPGQSYDAESGLNYNFHRDYDPTTGRYVESDPIGLKGGISTFGYVGGNPLSGVDPYGLWTLQIGFNFGYNFSVFGYGFSGVAGVGTAIDGHGNIAPYGYLGGGTAVGTPGGFATVGIADSNADTICGLKGGFNNQSLNLGAEADVNIDHFNGTDLNGQRIDGGGFSLGAGLGAGVSAGYTNTGLGPIGHLW